MNKTELINKLLWLGYTSPEEGKEKRKEAVSIANNLVDKYLEAINYTRCCTEFICHSCNEKKSGQNDDQLHEVCKECFGSI